jgi:hypothetical protein
MRGFPSPILSAPMQHGITENLKFYSLFFVLVRGSDPLQVTTPEFA